MKVKEGHTDVGQIYGLLYARKRSKTAVIEDAGRKVTTE